MQGILSVYFPRVCHSPCKGLPLRSSTSTGLLVLWQARSQLVTAACEARPRSERSRSGNTKMATKTPGSSLKAVREVSRTFYSPLEPQATLSTIIRSKMSYLGARSRSRSSALQTSRNLKTTNGTEMGHKMQNIIAEMILG